MISLEYGKNKFKVIYPYTINNSINNVTFSSISIDFTGFKLEDLPYKYQEVKLVDDTENRILFTGYFDSPDFSDMKLPHEERILTLNLLSPLKMAQVRCVTLTGTYKIKEAVIRILQPLIDDGYKLCELNISDGQITLNHVLQTIDYCMNDIGHKRNILWFIDCNKNIFVNSLDYLFGKEKKLDLNEEEYQNGMFHIQPTVESSDYANVINIKNIRLFYSERDSYFSDTLDNQGEGILINLPKKIKKGDNITLNNPIVIDEERLKQYIQNGEIYSWYMNCNFRTTIQLENGNTKVYFIGIDPLDNIYKKSDKITFQDDDGDEGEIVLQRDSFFKNLITGFKYNGDEDATIVEIQSNTALRHTSMRFMDNKEIQSLKGVVSLTGQIEKTVDYVEKWTTLEEITEYAKSLIIENTNTVNTINLKFDEDHKLEIGDILKIDMPNFYIQGNFAVSSVNCTCNNEDDKEWDVVIQNSDMISSYIDIFRPTEQQTTEDPASTMILSEYAEEVINEIHEIEVLEDED